MGILIFYFTFLRRSQSRWRIFCKLSFLEGSRKGPISCCAHLSLCVHSVSSTGNFLLAPCTWLRSPSRMKANTVLIGMLCTATCQKDSVRPQGILCSCQCLPASDDFRRAGAEVGQEEGPWTPAACSSSSLYPSRVCVGIQPKASSYLNKGEAIEKQEQECLFSEHWREQNVYGHPHFHILLKIFKSYIFCWVSTPSV